MRYGGVLLAVRDVKKSRQFYEMLFGLEVAQDYGINLAFTCGITLQQEFDWLVEIPKESNQYDSHSFELYFEVEDFQEFYQKLEKMPALYFRGNRKRHTWGQEVIRFYDPDGHLIEVGESMKVVIQRFLSQGLSREQIAEKMDASEEDLRKLI